MTPTMRMCLNCAWRPARAKGRCWSCYHYRRRTGHERPSNLILAHLERTIDHQLARRSQPA